jgi:hypothetical protein
MDYLVDGKKYNMSYQALREQYILFCEMTDNKFMSMLPRAIHFACVVCYLKETPTYICLSDEGIIHQLAHLLDIPKCELIQVKEIRELFKQQLILA